MITERVGTGTTDVVEKCVEAGLEPPVFIQEEDFRVIIYRKAHIAGAKAHIAGARTHIAESKTHIAESKTHIVESKTHIVESKTHIVEAKLTKKQRAVIAFCETPKTSREIIAHIGIVYQARAVKRYITDLIVAGMLLPVVVGKANSPNQKYVSAIRRDSDHE